MYAVVISDRSGSTVERYTTRRREAFALMRRVVKQGAVWAEIEDRLFRDKLAGYGVPPEERLLRAIFNEPLPGPRSYVWNGSDWEVIA